MSEPSRQDIALTPRDQAPEKMPIRAEIGKPHQPIEQLTMVKLFIPESQRQTGLNLDFSDHVPHSIFVATKYWN
jgi:hypothetical protein